MSGPHRRTPARRHAYSSRRHDIATGGRHGAGLEAWERQVERVHPGDCSILLEYDHPVGVTGCVVRVAPETELERRAQDGDR